MDLEVLNGFYGNSSKDFERVPKNTYRTSANRRETTELKKIYYSNFIIKYKQFRQGWNPATTIIKLIF